MPERTTDTAPGQGEQYVGYLPVPPRQRRFLRAAVPLLGAGFVIVAVGWAWTTRSPGPAIWDTSEVRTFEGVLFERPYPRVRVADAAAPGGARTMLLVLQGKRGAASVAKGLDGRAVRLRGYVLRRDELRLLELESDSIDALPAADGERLAATLRPSAVSLGRRALRGEIIDPKCYGGAMKPGRGKTHKECAVLCISGGVPPMFLAGTDAGARLHLLADPQGNRLGDEILPFVADDVEIAGEVEQRGDLLLLKIDASTIRRR